MKPKRMKFARVAYGVLQSEAFVLQAANKYPELLAKAIDGMKKPRAANETFVKLFIGQIFETKNPVFVQELAEANNADDSILERSKMFDLPILKGILVNTEAAAKNYVWYPVGEGTIKSLKYDQAQIDFITRPYDPQLQNEFWSYKIHIATVYFNYMVRETIYRNGGWHMWLFYYHYFVDHLIKLIPLPNSYDHAKGFPSFAHYFIEEIVGNLTGWLHLAKNQETDNRVIDTVRCIGTCLYHICEADDLRLSRDFKATQVGHILSTYFEFSDDDDNVGAVTARKWLEQMFSKSQIHRPRHRCAFRWLPEHTSICLGSI